ncbi:hypothetical protein NW762_008672 [Fusarium torreyae]|uniref:Uncharacterized protein n=1 Tax=Fusarium torreyae TaxID=1237075 RepID=A0A9W8VF91_9HYPO|nr:hypothetical protein NW762_008672 [Fusarium torreyae]
MNNIPRAFDGIAETEDDYSITDRGSLFNSTLGSQPAQRPFNSAPYPPRAPNGRRNIVVQLYDLEPRAGRFGQAGERFSVDRETLFALLPRTRYAVRRGTLMLDSFFLPEDMDPHPPQMIHRALHFVFHHFQEYTRIGVLDMFGAAAQEIEDDPVRDRAVRRWAAMMHALCVVLDNERGLGCSEDLLYGILAFFESFVRDVHDLLGWNETMILFEAFAGIFRTERRTLVLQIRRIWNRFDPEVQEQLLRDMRRALPAEGIDGMAHRMYRTLGY